MDMKRKLRSEKGASITFALLLFLVCAMVSSVVIVAATTASGRMSNLAEIDQRYYAVSSAAELLGATLNGKSVKVVEEQTQTTTTAYDASGNVVGTPSKSYNPTIPSILFYDDEDTMPRNESYSILTSTAAILTENDQLFETGSGGGDGDGDGDGGGGDGGDVPTPSSTDDFPKRTALSLTASGGGDAVSGDLGLLKVYIYEELAKDGTLTFYVSKPLSDGDAGPSTLGYTLRMIFEPEKTEDIVSHVEHGSPVLTGSNGGYKITDKETITKTIVYKWTLIGVKKSNVPT